MSKDSNARRVCQRIREGYFAEYTDDILKACFDYLEDAGQVVRDGGSIAATLDNVQHGVADVTVQYNITAEAVSVARATGQPVALVDHVFVNRFMGTLREYDIRRQDTLNTMYRLDELAIGWRGQTDDKRKARLDNLSQALARAVQAWRNAGAATLPHVRADDKQRLVDDMATITDYATQMLTVTTRILAGAATGDDLADVLAHLEGNQHFYSVLDALKPIDAHDRVEVARMMEGELQTLRAAGHRTRGIKRKAAEAVAASGVYLDVGTIIRYHRDAAAGHDLATLTKNEKPD